MTGVPSDREHVRQQMGEAVVLPAEDAQRQQVERLVADQGPWAQEEWRALGDEQRSLRSQVPRVFAEMSVPRDLDQRLLAIPNGPSARARSAVSRRWLLAAAATAALVMLGVFLGTHAQNNSRLQTLTVLAINNHVNHVEEEGDFKSAPASSLEDELSQLLKLDVAIPSLGDEVQLIGGRKCKLGTHLVAYTLWQGPRGKLSLFQCRADDFGLPSEMPGRLVRAKDIAVGEQPDVALIWTESDRGYVLVGGSESELERLARQQMSP